MARIHWGLAALVLGASIGAGACTKTKPANTTVVSNQPASMGDPKDDLAFLPADSELVLGVDFAQIKKSALWAQYAPPLLDKLNASLADFKAACGFNGIDQLTSVSLAMKNLDGDSPDGVLVVRGTMKAMLTPDCVAKLSAKAKEEGGTFALDGDTYVHTSSRGHHAAMRFIGDHTLLMTVGTQGTKDGLAAIAKGGAGLDTSPAFTDLMKGVDRTRSMWFAMNGNSPVFAQMASLGAKPKAVFGSVNITDGLTFDGAMRFGTPDEAQSLLAMSKSMTDNPQVKAMFDKLEINATGTDLTASVAMGPQKLQALVAMLGGIIGGG